MSQFPRLQEAIKLAEPDESEKSIGWHVVRESDNKQAAGPYKSYSEAVSDMKTKAWFKTHGGPADKVFYIEHGWIDDDDIFHEMPADEGK